VFETSIQAHTLLARVMRARNEAAIEVRPEQSGPINSVTAPIGRPPASSASSTSIPLAATGRLGSRCEGRRNLRSEGGFDLKTDVEADGIGECIRQTFAYLRVRMQRLLHRKLGVQRPK
jgi:hypothetical protein